MEVNNLRTNRRAQIGNITIPLLKGDQGYSISRIVRTSGDGGAGTIDTYTVYIDTDPETAIGTFQVVNGTGGDMSKNVYDIDNDDIVDRATGDGNGNEITATYETIENVTALASRVATLEQAGYITKSVADLANYYLKSETYTKQEVNNLCDRIPKFAIEVVSVLPTQDISETTIYLLRDDEETQDVYQEYIYVNNTWERIGGQRIDLSNYYQKNEVDDLLNDKADTSDLDSYYTKNSVDGLLNQKINTNDIIDNLTSTNNTKVLSAKQGKALKDLLDINNNNISTESTERVNADNLLQSQITSLASGSPLVASSTADMTDTTKIYVLTTDGHWYWYDGDSWEDGGVYQATEDSEAVNQLREDLNNLNDGIETFLSKATFKRGWLLNGNYKDTSTSKVACVNTITIDRKLELHIADGFKAGFHVFENGVFSYDTGWKTGIFYLAAGAKFKMCVCRVNEDPSELADVTDFVEKVTFSSKINDKIVSVENDIEDIKESSISGIPNVYYTKYKNLFNGYRPTAGTTIVGNEMWVFQSSRDDFSTYADVKRYSLDDFSEITQGNITHNLGHANTVDYCEETDCIIVGNASLGNETPRFDIITNVSSLMDGNNHQITYGEDNVISYDCSLFGGHYLSCCFGGDKRTAFIVMGGESGTLENPRGFKIQLGMGNVDISNWGNKGGGTFISGKSNNEYNGTFYVVGEGVSETYLGALQGMCFYNGNLYVASGGNIARIYEVQMTTSGKMFVKNSYQIDMYYTSNARVNLEPEGLCVYKGVYFIMYVGGMDNQYDSQTLLIPIGNRQCGTGVVKERVTLDFKCNHIPNIHITPTSNVTGLYISQVDKEGFTVSSSSNESGTFNWECDIY